MSCRDVIQRGNSLPHHHQVAGCLHFLIKERVGFSRLHPGRFILLLLLLSTCLINLCVSSGSRDAHLCRIVDQGFQFRSNMDQISINFFDREQRGSTERKSCSFCDIKPKISRYSTFYFQVHLETLAILSRVIATLYRTAYQVLGSPKKKNTTVDSTIGLFQSFSFSIREKRHLHFDNPLERTTPKSFVSFSLAHQSNFSQGVIFSSSLKIAKKCDF